MFNDTMQGLMVSCEQHRILHVLWDFVIDPNVIILNTQWIDPNYFRFRRQIQHSGKRCAWGFG